MTDMNKPNLSKMTPDELRLLYESDRNLLETGSLDEKREVAKRHVLKVFPIAGEARVNDAIVSLLQKEVREGHIDDATLQSVKDLTQAPSFEEVVERATGMQVNNRGSLVVGQKLIGDTVLRVFYNIFDSDKHRQRADAGQRFASEVAKHILDTATDHETLNALTGFKPKVPVYSGKNILANVFIEGRELKELLQEADVEERYLHLQKVALAEAAMYHHARPLLEQTQWKDVFPEVNHEHLLVNHVLARSDVALANKLKKGVRPKEVQQLVDLLKIEGPRSFTQGDAIPSNTMVAVREHDVLASAVLGKSKEFSYTPIDFEFAGLDVPEAMLAQRLVKSPVYDAKGQSLRLANGKTMEEELLNEVIAYHQRQDPLFDPNESQERFYRVKAQLLLMWAARYKELGENDAVQNQDVARVLSKYFHSLFAQELKRQKKDDSVINYTSTIFGAPLSDNDLEKVFEAYHPESGSVSLLKTIYVRNASHRLEEMVKQYNRKSLRSKMTSVAGALLIPVVVGAVSVGAYVQKRMEELKIENAKEKKEKEYQKLLKIIRLEKHQTTDTLEFLVQYRLRAWESVFKDTRTAYAAFANYDETYQAMQKADGSVEYRKFEKFLPKDIQDFVSSGYDHLLDSFVWYRKPGSDVLEVEESAQRKVQEEMKNVKQKYSKIKNE